MSERVTVRAPLGWRYAPQGDGSAVAQDSMVDRLLALIRASEGPPAAELALWLAPAGLERVMSVAAWFAAWAAQRPLFLQGHALGFTVPGHDLLAFVSSMQADLGPPTSVEFGHTKLPQGVSIVVRYTWPDLEPLVFSRCPRVAAEGWPMPTELPPMPDAWRQEEAGLPVSLPKGPDAHELLAQWGPGRLDIGLDRTKRGAAAAAQASSAVAGSAPTAPPADPTPASPTPTSSPSPGPSGDGPSLGEQMNEAMADLTAYDEASSEPDAPPTDDEELAERPVDSEPPPPPKQGTLYVPIAVVLCVLCRHERRLKLAEVVEAYKAGCPECKKDPGALVVTEEENGSTTPLVHYLRAAGVFDPKVAVKDTPPGPPERPSPAASAGSGGAAAPAGAPSAEPRRRPARKKAGAGEH